MSVCVSVGGCVSLPLFSDVVLSACPVTWDGEQEREQEMKMAKKQKGCLNALLQRCLSAF